MRLVNLCDHAVTAELAFRGELFRTNMAETSEELLGKETCRLAFGPKQVITLRLEGDRV